MHSNTNNWLKPSFRSIDAHNLLEQGWNREQLLAVRSLIERSRLLVDVVGKPSGAAAELRELRDAIDAELATA